MVCANNQIAFRLLKEPEATWDGVALTTYGYRNHTVRSNRWRYIRYENGDDELYDHSKDEYEWTILAANSDYANVIENLAAYFPELNVEGTRIPKIKK